MLFSQLFNELEHDAKPLLSAAAKWAEQEGLVIVKQVQAEVKTKTPAELVALFNSTVGSSLGVSVQPGATISADAQALLTTALARAKASELSGSSLRTSILNAGIEQAELLFKGLTGDTATAPPLATPATTK